MSTVIDTTLLDAMIATNPAKLGQAVGMAAFHILGEAQKVTPRDPARPPQDESVPVSGALRANTDVTKEDINGLIQRVNYYQEYAPYQELGAPAINLPARPFLTPAVENGEAYLVQKVKEAIGDV